MAIYRNIEPIELADNDSLNELKIDTTYHKGRGIYVSVKPVHRETICGLQSEHCIFSGEEKENGLYLLVKGIPRKSKKAEDAIMDALGRKADEIATAYDEGDYGKVKSIVLSCAV